MVRAASTVAWRAGYRLPHEGSLTARRFDPADARVVSGSRRREVGVPPDPVRRDIRRDICPAGRHVDRAQLAPGFLRGADLFGVDVFFLAVVAFLAGRFRVVAALA